MFEEVDVAKSGVAGKVSILIPTFNLPNEAKRCIESILNYTSYPDFEICISDDASPNDELKAYLESIQSEKIKVVFGDAQLLYGANIMRAFRVSDGQFICLFNDDAYIPEENPDWLQKLVDGLKANPTYSSITPLVLYANKTVYWAGKKKENSREKLHDFLHVPYTDPRIPTTPVECCYNNFSCCVMWRELINHIKIGEHSNHYGSDSWWCGLIRKKFGLLPYMEPVTYVYHDNAFNKRG